MNSQLVFISVKLLSLILHFIIGVPLSEEASYDDLINCEAFPEVVNYTDAELEQEALRHGQCIPYTTETRSSSLRPNPCHAFYRPGIDYVYLPFGRARNDITWVNSFAADASLVIDILQPQCREPATRAICYYYYPPCGNITHFAPPNALCQDVCYYLTDNLCSDEWALTLDFLSGIDDFIESLQVQFLNCSRPGAPLGLLPHCCSDSGIDIMPVTSDSGADSNDTSAATKPASDSTTLVAASVSAVLAVLLVVGVTVVTVTLCLLVRKSRSKVILQFGAENVKHSVPGIIVTDTPPLTPGSIRYVPATIAGGEGSLVPGSTMRTRVPSGFIRNMDECNMLIPGRHLQLLDTIGQGEFGVVYRGQLTVWQGRATAELVAIKTLKNFYSTKDVDDLLKESEKMRQFSHPNVLSLIGVCIEVGDTPYIVMPYMANGSLLVYLRKERPHLTIAGEAGAEMIADAQRKLLSISLQIAKGMSYLAEQKFVHRDLAARNCMIDQHLLIKVADFGLSEDIYSRNYFRQGQLNEEGSTVKLPIRWMALESLLDHVFTEKTDVWSYGVTCWEVFSLGHTPYPAVDPFSLIKFLQNGNRLDKPANAACSPQVYDVITGCWAESPDKRPSFEDLSQAINSLLEGVAGYMDFSAFSNESARAGASGYDHLAGVGSGYNHLEPLENVDSQLDDKVEPD